MRTTISTIILFFVLILTLCALVVFGPLAQADAMKMNSIIIVLTALLSFFFSLLTKDHSWTDRLWSTLPVIMAWIYAKQAAFATPSLVAALMVSVWGLRLTYNFARRGGYSSEEDYRWSILKKKIGNTLGWQLFNLLFIAVYQQFLFLAFTSPLYLLNAETDPSFPLLSYLAILLFLLFLGIEATADQQQYTFQEAKHHKQPRNPNREQEYAQGFCSSGLFKYSRHPNYFGELGIWYALYLYCVSFQESLVQASLIGPILLTLLFIGSTIFTESITKNKYPHYAEYQKKVPAIVCKPW